MPKQSKEQFSNLLNEATAQMKDEIAKREIITFRVDEQSLKLLQDLSVKEKKHVGALVREWVLERLSLEIQEHSSIEMNKLAKSTNTQIKLIHKELEHMRHYLHELEKRVS